MFVYVRKTHTKDIRPLRNPVTLSHKTLTLASSLLSESLTQAATQLQNLYTQLPPSLQSYLDTASHILRRSLPHQATKPPSTALEKASVFLASTSSTTLTTALLPLLALLFFMSRSYWPSGGRYSPFTHASVPPPRVTEDDYHYIIDDDTHSHDPAPRYHHRDDDYGFPSNSTSHRPSRVEPQLSPDILILRHKGTTYPLHFPAFAISEGHLKVHEVRRLAARETKCEDPRRIKLIYKGKALNNDHRACKDENLKQNSEIMLVVSSEPYRDDGNESSSSASSGPRVDVDGTLIDNSREPRTKRKGHRGGGRKKKSSAQTSPRESGYLAPPTANGSSSSRQPSPSRRVPSPAPPPPKKPSTPTEALDMISANFDDNWVPQCEQFMRNPPPDTKTRDFEYKKLCEGILAQVILKLDEVTTDGDPALRARRKELVTYTQDWLKNLDTTQKKFR